MTDKYNFSDVMISYSRRDKAFVKRLETAFKEQGDEVWVDWEDIMPTEDWWKAIEAGIEAADTFVFIISPDSIQSKYCMKEFQHALNHNKKIVPVVYRQVEDPEVKVLMPPEMRALNWVYMREEDHFRRAFLKLRETLRTDLDHVRAHTRLTVRANEWDVGKRPNSLLLRGEDAHAANAWLQASLGEDHDPPPTQLQREYIDASMRAAVLLRARGAVIAFTIFVMTALVTLLSWGLIQQQAELSQLRDQQSQLIAQLNELQQSGASPEEIAAVEEQIQALQDAIDEANTFNFSNILPRLNNRNDSPSDVETILLTLATTRPPRPTATATPPGLDDNNRDAGGPSGPGTTDPEPTAVPPTSVRATSTTAPFTPTPAPASVTPTPHVEADIVVSCAEAFGDGAFAGGNGDCYTCPDGYTRSANGTTCEQTASQDVSAATFVRSNSCDALYPGSTEIDGACYTCPAGQTLVRDADSGAATCVQGASEQTSAATRVQNATCGSGQVLANGNECWACPSGYTRTSDPITGARACQQTTPAQTSRATLETSLASCSELYPGSFEHQLSGDCYTCPEGYNRTVFGINADNACERLDGKPATLETSLASCSELYPGSFEHQLSGDCYTCPEGYNRTVFGINADNACEKPATTDYRTATYEGSLGSCPELYTGSFLDTGRGDCWSCPSGYSRNLEPVASDRACTNNNNLFDTTAATLRGNPVTSCPAGTFQHMLSGDCYSCPSGFNRTVFDINGSQACERVNSPQYARATQVGQEVNSCPAGTFQHQLSGDCYSCPPGYDRTIYSIDAPNACETTLYARATQVGQEVNSCPAGTFQHQLSGDCYSCPLGYTRTLAGINAADACAIAASTNYAAATRVSTLSCPAGSTLEGGACWSCPSGYSRTGSAVTAGDACIQTTAAVSVAATRAGSLGCPAGSFFDPRNGGECWSCPDDYLRSLSPVTASNACTRTNPANTVAAELLGSPD